MAGRYSGLEMHASVMLQSGKLQDKKTVSTFRNMQLPLLIFNDIL